MVVCLFTIYYSINVHINLTYLTFCPVCMINLLSPLLRCPLQILNMLIPMQLIAYLLYHSSLLNHQFGVHCYVAVRFSVTLAACIIIIKLKKIV